MQQYELGQRDYFSIQVIPKTNLTTKGKEVREARYVSAGEPKLYLKKIEKSTKKENKLNTLTKSFAGVAARWWKGHKAKITIFEQASTLLYDRFEERKEIKKYTPDQDAQEHINLCEKGWMRQGIPEEQWTHRFSKTLDLIPYTWYQVEEANGNTKCWQTLKENFTKDFRPTSNNSKVRIALSCIQEKIVDKEEKLVTDEDNEDRPIEEID